MLNLLVGFVLGVFITGMATSKQFRDKVMSYVTNKKPGDTKTKRSKRSDDDKDWLYDSEGYKVLRRDDDDSVIIREIRMRR